MRICFVCLGNICRSPTAHGVMEKLVEDAGLASRITIDSAGTGGWHVGELPDPRSREAASLRGYDLSHHARQFVALDLDRFDLVLAMDRSNLRHLQAMAGGRTTPRIELLRAFDPGAPPGAEVPDPYSGGRDGFELVLDICERACRGVLDYARERIADR
jgi:protein-tyrosine phosphatase